MHVTHGVVHLGGGRGGVGGGDGGKSNGVKKRERERLTHSIFILLDVRIPSSWILCEIMGRGTKERDPLLCMKTQERILVF